MNKGDKIALTIILILVCWFSLENEYREGNLSKFQFLLFLVEFIHCATFLLCFIAIVSLALILAILIPIAIILEIYRSKHKQHFLFVIAIFTTPIIIHYSLKWINYIVD